MWGPMFRTRRLLLRVLLWHRVRIYLAISKFLCLFFLLTLQSHLIIPATHFLNLSNTQAGGTPTKPSSASFLEGDSTAIEEMDRTCANIYKESYMDDGMEMGDNIGVHGEGSAAQNKTQVSSLLCNTVCDELWHWYATNTKPTYITYFPFSPCRNTNLTHRGPYSTRLRFKKNLQLRSQISQRWEVHWLWYHKYVFYCAYFSCCCVLS